MVHPLTARDAARKYPAAKWLPEPIIEKLIAKKKPVFMSEITGIRSITGAETSGIFIGCPLSSRQLADKRYDELALQRLIECAEMAKEFGAEVMGLGAFTAITGDAGITLAKRAPIAITTGNSYTVATAIEGAEKAAKMVGIDPGQATLAVVGATGSIGRTCAIVLSRDFAKTLLIGRDQARTEALLSDVTRGEATTDLERLKEADVVVTVTSSDTAIIEPRHLKKGAVVCDVSRPRDVSVRVAKERPDVLVIEGGVVKVPGNVDFGMSFGFPPQTAYACMSETMLLALENRPESYTLGKDVSVQQVDETLAWARKHGFELAGFRSFEKEVDAVAIERVRKAREGAAATVPAAEAVGVV